MSYSRKGLWYNYKWEMFGLGHEIWRNQTGPQEFLFEWDWIPDALYYALCRDTYWVYIGEFE